MKNGIMRGYEKALWYGYGCAVDRICSTGFGSSYHRPRTSSKPTLIGEFQSESQASRTTPGFSF